MQPVGYVLAAIIALAPQKEVDANSAFCLAQNIYFEARSASERDQRLVANTTLRRAERGNRSVCAEVFKRGSYQWVTERRDILSSIRSSPVELAAWRAAVRIAVGRLSGHDEVHPVHPHYFYSPRAMKPPYSVPSWAEGKTVLASSKDFVFLDE